MPRDGFVRRVSLQRASVADWDAYPFSIPAIRGLEALELDPGVTFLVGANGSGKSTLLEALAIAAGLNPEGGGRNFRFALRPTESALGDHLQLERSAAWPPRTDFFLRAESLFNVATQIDELFGPDELDVYGGSSLHEQSHGESFLAIAVNRFGPRGLFLLDEPEAALSPQGQLALLMRLNELVAQDSQLVIATHSPLLLAFPAAQIYELGEEGIARRDYDDLELVELYRSFLRDPGRYLRHLGDGRAP